MKKWVLSRRDSAEMISKIESALAVSLNLPKSAQVACAEPEDGAVFMRLDGYEFVSSGETFFPFLGPRRRWGSSPRRVDPNAGTDAVRELRRAVKQLGMRGLKVHSSANSVYLNDRRRMFPIYEFCQESSIPILFHTGTTGLGDCEIRYSKTELVDEVCQAFPDLKVVMAHFGWPWPDVAIAIALRNPNVFIDVSGWKPKYIPQSVMPYLNGILQDRFLFGTDYPMLRQEEWMGDFRANLAPRLKPGVADKLLSGNAKRLLAG